MPNGIDPCVHTVPYTTFEALLHRPATYPEVGQLTPTHNPMLSSCQPPNHPIYVTRDAFAPRGVVNASFVPHAVEC